MTDRKTYVVVTGAVAAGASTLAQELLRVWNAQPFLEEQIEVSNPFFTLAQNDVHRWGFTSQVHFILASVERHRRLKEIAASGAGSGVIIEDRTPFEHTGAYAQALRSRGSISESEFELLVSVTEAVSEAYIAPDLLIYREMTDEQLTDRVRSRNRDGESDDFSSLKAIHAAFETFIASWDRSPIIRVPSDVDVLSEAGLQSVLDAVAEYLPSESIKRV